MVSNSFVVTMNEMQFGHKSYELKLRAQTVRIGFVITIEIYRITNIYIIPTNNASRRKNKRTFIHKRKKLDKTAHATLLHLRNLSNLSLNNFAHDEALVRSCGACLF